MASGIIPEDNDDDEGATYDDVGLDGAIEPIDEDIYEELPGVFQSFCSQTNTSIKEGVKMCLFQLQSC
ncbi:UNVERIFIED_CONTAM: hypothetical protein FKN15_018964 [Acipenser sinensis]